jgi:hypothetical protein
VRYRTFREKLQRLNLDPAARARFAPPTPTPLQGENLKLSGNGALGIGKSATIGIWSSALYIVHIIHNNDYHV